MGAIKLTQFGGMLPAWDETLLPDGQAASSLNGYLFSGALQGWRQPKLLRDLTNSAAKFAYRVPTITKAAARAYLVFVANPQAGDTVKVAEITYEFVSVVAKKNDVLVGATATDSAAQFLDVLIGTGANLAVSQTANPNVSTTDCSAGQANFGAGTYPFVKVVAPDYGAAYNLTQVAEGTNGVRMKWVSDFLLTDTTTTFVGGANQTIDTSLVGAATWLEFVDKDTSVVRSPVVDDKFGRHYFASPSTPPQYNTYDRIAAGQPAFLLGVPAPACPPGVTVSGGGSAATLGANTVDAVNNFVVPANHIYLVPITASGAMSLLDVVFEPAVTAAGTNYFAMLFADNAGVPGTLMNTSVVAQGLTADTAVTLDFINPSGLLDKTQYWIGLIFDTDTAIHNAVSFAPITQGYEAASPYTNGPPATCPAVGSTPNVAYLFADLQTSSVQSGRSYVYTWVTAYDEEGPPSPYTLVNGWSNGTWTIDLFQPPPDDEGVQRNITTVNIYRTIPDQTGSTVYYFVGSVPVGTASYVDSAPDSTVALNASLESTNWFPPPEGLQDIKAMPNGMMVGFKGNEIWFCEPYRPHAWPPGYVLTTEFPIVGIGVSGQNCVAATGGYPYVANGVSPGVAVLTKVLIPEPCISRGSVVGTDAGVYYMSPNGLVLIDNNSQGVNYTESWITREKWRALTPQTNPRAVFFASQYFAFDQGAQVGFHIELKADSSSFTIWPQPGGHRVGFQKLSAPNSVNVDNLMVDPWTGILMLIQSNAIYYYDFSDAAPVMVPFKWRSKQYQQATKSSFAAFRVFFNVPANSPALGVRNTAAFNDASWNTLGANQYLIVRVFADGNLVTVREVQTNGEIMRIASGFKADIWQFEMEGRVVISNLQVATSTKQLAQV